MHLTYPGKTAWKAIVKYTVRTLDRVFMPAARAASMKSFLKIYRSDRLFTPVFSRNFAKAPGFLASQRKKPSEPDFCT